MRNWWIEVTIDGRTHKLAGGPQAAVGGFSARVYQRSRSHSIEVLRVDGVCNGAELLLHGVDRNGAEVEVVTER